jgi:hypothetical protein
MRSLRPLDKSIAPFPSRFYERRTTLGFDAAPWQPLVSKRPKKMNIHSHDRKSVSSIEFPSARRSRIQKAVREAGRAALVLASLAIVAAIMMAIRIAIFVPLQIQ